MDHEFTAFDFFGNLKTAKLAKLAEVAKTEISLASCFEQNFFRAALLTEDCKNRLSMQAINKEETSQSRRHI